MKKVLDVCCGPKGMWFDKHDERALFLDRRCETHKNKYPSGYKEMEIKPDIVGDFTNIQQPDSSFYLVVFDPPHIKRSETNSGEIGKRYGKLNGEWKDMLQKGFAECFRVLKPNGLLIFKWCEVEIPIKEILELTDHKPLFGHKTKKNLLTHWITFMKSTNAKGDMMENQKIECSTRMAPQDCYDPNCPVHGFEMISSQKETEPKL